MGMGSEIAERIRRFIQEEILRDEARELDSDTLLLEEGLIDSMGVELLTSFIEDDLQVQLEPEDVTARNLRTVDSIAQLVDRRAGRSG
jgi:acyl carrier protein